MSGDSARLALLERYGSFYGAERFALAWTTHNRPDSEVRADYLRQHGAATEDDLDDEQRAKLSDLLGGAKVVRERGWPTTRPLPDGSFGAGLCKQRGETRNPAIVVRPSGLVALESDSPADLAAVEALGLTPTLTVASSGPGKRHWYFRPAAGIETLPLVAFRFESGVVTGDAERYFLAPAAMHPSGTAYSFVPGHGPGEVAVAELSTDAYRQLCQLAREHDDDERERIAVDPDAKIVPGRRRERVFKLACSLWAQGVPAGALETAALAFNAERCEPPLRAEQVRSQVRGALTRYQPGTSLPPDALLDGPLEMIDGAELLDDLAGFLDRFLVLPSQEARDLLGVWVLHTWTIDAASATPYLRVTSAGPGSGKSTVCDALALLVRAPWQAITPSPAVLYRRVDRDRPTLLLDELDGYSFEDRRDALAVLNAGYKRGATVDRCTDKGELQSFSAYCPKLFAGIDERALPPALLSRTITIRMEPRRAEEPVEDLSDSAVSGDAGILRDRCRRWADLALDDLEGARPDTLGMINRPAEVWRPLLAIGEQIGGSWQERIRRAAVVLGSGGDALDERSRPTQLLADIREALAGGDSISTRDLLAYLNGLEESPWGARRRGEGLDARGLAGLLRPYSVKPRNLKVGGEVVKGYRLDDLEPVFARYLADPGKSATSATSVIHAGLREPDPLPGSGSERYPVADAGAQIPLDHAEVADVAQVAHFPNPTPENEARAA